MGKGGENIIRVDRVTGEGAGVKPVRGFWGELYKILKKKGRRVGKKTKTGDTDDRCGK